MVKDFDLELYKNWKMTKEKEAIISELEQRAECEKSEIPKLLSRYDLMRRWKMNNRQSVHNVIRKRKFPEPIYRFSNGNYPLYLESEIEIFELKNPMIVTPESRENYAKWISLNVILDN